MTETASFQAPTVDVLANALWFCSLSVSLVCALLATLVQQWSRDYVRDIRRRQTLDESLRGRAFNHIYVRMGVDRYGMDQMVSWLVALVHLAVALFAAGLFLFLYPINSAVAVCTTTVLGTFGITYTAVSIIPLFDPSCPLRTPLTYAFAFVYWILLHASRLPMLSFIDYFIKSLWPRHVSLRDVLARQWNISGSSGTSDEIEFFYHSSKRFIYAWESTSRHMFNPTQILSLMLSTISLFEQSSTTEDIHERLCYLADDYGLVNQLSSYIREVGPASAIDADASIVVMQMTFFVLQEILAQEANMNQDSQLFRGLYVGLIFFIARGEPRLVAEDTRHALIARFCLCHLRYSLLYLCQRSSDPELVSFPESELIYYFTQYGRYVHSFRDVHRNVILLLLNSWQYNRIDLGWRDVNPTEWQHDATSCLVPLHDSGCCRLRYGPRSHAAACNALTMISHLLDASDADRAYVLNGDLLERFFSLQRGFPLMDWQFYLTMRRKADRHLPPSEEFMSVLRRAGLRAWLNPNNDFSTGPPDEPHLQFITRTFEVGKGFAARTFTVLDVLRRLAEHVDFANLAIMSTQWTIDPQSGPSSLPHPHPESGSNELGVVPMHSADNEAACSDGFIARGTESYDLDSVADRKGD